MSSRQTRDLTGRRILVVEDEYFIADEICVALTQRGARIVGPVPSLEQAHDLVERNGIDCAVLDINLRGQSVFDLAQRLRSQAVPMVFATGYNASVISKDLGPIAHLPKPIDLRALIEAVRDACERQ